MTGRLMTDIATGVQRETLYGTPVFQVRLWRLAPGAKLSPFPSEKDKQSQGLLIRGAVSIQSGREENRVESGQRFETGIKTASALENQGSQPVIFLELCRGNGFEAFPLQEITETRPWGSFTVLKDEPDYKLKELRVIPGNRLSLQRHDKREEHWLVTQGQPEVTLDTQTHHLNPGDYICIPRRAWHRITNPAPAGSGAEVEIVELQLGDYFGEDDIERREDDYGRA